MNCEFHRPCVDRYLPLVLRTLLALSIVTVVITVMNLRTNETLAHLFLGFGLHK